jgi:hypothetical protein
MSRRTRLWAVFSDMSKKYGRRSILGSPVLALRLKGESQGDAICPQLAFLIRLLLSCFRYQP